MLVERDEVLKEGGSFGRCGAQGRELICGNLYVRGSLYDEASRMHNTAGTAPADDKAGKYLYYAVMSSLSISWQSTQLD